MTWSLPDCEHRTFTRNPLEVVICQLRFDPVLKVHAGVADFQERVRHRFPRYEDRQGQLVEFAPTGLQSRAVRDHAFYSRTRPATIVLGDQSCSLEYRDHRDRNELLDDAELVFGALQDVFGGISAVRLGLRYVNRIDRDAIARDLGRTLGWQDLIAEQFLSLPGGTGELAEVRFATEITRAVASGGAMTARYGLLPIPDQSVPIFRLDVDRYTEQNVSVPRVPTMLGEFSNDIYRLFVTAIGKDLRIWMEAQA